MCNCNTCSGSRAQTYIHWNRFHVQLEHLQWVPGPNIYTLKYIPWTTGTLAVGPGTKHIYTEIYFMDNWTTLDLNLAMKIGKGMSCLLCFHIDLCPSFIQKKSHTLHHVRFPEVHIHFTNAFYLSRCLRWGRGALNCYNTPYIVAMVTRTYSTLYLRYLVMANVILERRSILSEGPNQLEPISCQP